MSEHDRLLVLGGPERSIYEDSASRVRPRQEIRLSSDTQLRFSEVLGVGKALGELFEATAEGVAWLKGPRDAPPFGGSPPMRPVTAGTLDGLMLVRRYLEGMNSGLSAAPNAPDRDVKPMSDGGIA